MNNKQQTKKLMIFYTTTWRKFLTTTGMAMLASSVYLGDAQAQSFTNSGSLLIAQNLGGIERKIPLTEVPLSVMASVRAVTNGEPTYAQVEVKSDNSLVYEVGGQNQQGFKFEVEVTPNGTITDVAEEVESSAVPAPVFQALKQWAPNIQIISTWRSTRLGEFVYEFVIKDYWLEVAADGSKVTINRRQRSLSNRN